MKKKTLISRLKDEVRLRELKGSELVLAVGGIPTITNCDGKCPLHVEQGDLPPT